MNAESVNQVGFGEVTAEAQANDLVTYVHRTGAIAAWDGDGWYKEGRSWFETCYIHTGISGAQFVLSGPDAQRLLSDLAINDVYTWKIGKCKHIVICNEDGLILTHALYMRDAEDVFRTTAGIPVPFFQKIEAGGYDVKVDVSNVYILQFSGPTSLTVLESLLKVNLHDLPFLGTRMLEVPGLGITTELCRIGMTGTLAYELRGPIEEGPAVYAAALEAGRPHGLVRMGWRTYPVNHTFGGFPQITCSFDTALFEDKAFREESLLPYKPSGSVEPDNRRARYRTPGEVDWLWMAKFNHDFPGRAALEAEKADPKRTIMSLVWDVDDLVDIYRSLWEEGEPYKYLEIPASELQPSGGHQDYVLTEDGKEVGYASAPLYSSWYHQTVSQCAIDIDQAFDGNRLVIRWGDYGHRMKDVHVTVRKFPLIDAPDNRDYDLSTVPRGDI